MIDLNKATQQQIFDISTKHLFKQNAKSEINTEFGGKRCMYRGPGLPDGTCLMCAVGPFIPDDKYTPDLEGHSANGVLERIGLIKISPAWQHHLGGLLRDLQDMHDNSPVHRWHEVAATIARRYNLQFT